MWNAEEVDKKNIIVDKLHLVVIISTIFIIIVVMLYSQNLSPLCIRIYSDITYCNIKTWYCYGVFIKVEKKRHDLKLESQWTRIFEHVHKFCFYIFYMHSILILWRLLRSKFVCLIHRTFQMTMSPSQISKYLYVNVFSRHIWKV